MERTTFITERKQIFKNNLNRFLKENKKMQKDLAEELKVSPSTVCDWLKCRSYPRLEKIFKIADIFKVDFFDLTEERHILKGISKNEQEFLDLFNDIPDDKKESAVSFLKTL